MVRHVRKTRKHAKKQKQQQKQHGGGFTYDGPTGISTGGVPIDARTPYDHCYADPRAAMMPNVGNPTMFGGGSGYGFVLNNDIGKVYADVARAPCPSVSGPSVSGPSVSGPSVSGQQKGGNNSPLNLVSYSAGYDMARPHSTDSAHFLEPVRYDRMCAGGRDTRRKHSGRKHSGRKHSGRKHSGRKHSGRKHSGQSRKQKQQSRKN